jgi:hypothetical protein
MQTHIPWQPLMQAADIGAALQHARNAATLSQELLGEYSRASVGNWLGGAGQDKSVGGRPARWLHQPILTQSSCSHTPTITHHPSILATTCQPCALRSISNEHLLNVTLQSSCSPCPQECQACTCCPHCSICAQVHSPARSSTAATTLRWLLSHTRRQQHRCE